MSLMRAIGTGIVLLFGGMAQSLTPAAAQLRTDQPVNPAERAIKTKLNAWTVGLAGGLLEGAPIRFATEIARVVERARICMSCPSSPAARRRTSRRCSTFEASTRPSSIPMRSSSSVPRSEHRSAHQLHPQPLPLGSAHLRPSGDPLARRPQRKKVNFNTPGTTAAYSGPLIFKRLNLDVEKVFIPHPTALEQMRKGEGGMAAVVFVTSKPVDAFLRGNWGAGFKFLPVEIDDLRSTRPRS